MKPKEVKALRGKLGLTGSKFAALLGVHPVTLRKWETGTQTITPMAERFMRLLAKTRGRKGRR
jgi:DNA-binding transcriptional regulator YiaG